MAHLAEFTRSVGEDVETGDEVAQVGDTGSLKGAYLYFELRKNGIAIDPADWLGEPVE
ncbi:M23 family metallopeptidase [Archangium sp.]|uniref:M23 family metallopeptidase n=1 Tax=Archangium sp. TaxID=1872627 RepID=UPI002D440C39|nr:M23 family metallopeptidase [Archangium sp.]HYO59756.1 M23 family metallopeptidase [Archangium sp.]